MHRLLFMSCLGWIGLWILAASSISMSSPQRTRLVPVKPRVETRLVPGLSPDQAMRGCKDSGKIHAQMGKLLR